MQKNPTKYCELRFYGNLNDFILKKDRQKSFRYSHFGSPTVKDIIESVGVPHVEVSIILVDGENVDFNFHPESGNRIACYPRFHSINIGGLNLLKEELNEPRFILDVHLGKLAKFLRIMGFDTLYRTDYKDAEIIRISNEENRIILTRDLGILRNGATKFGYFLRNTDPKYQLKELIDQFSLREKAQPFSRCSVCNGIVEAVDKSKIENQLSVSTTKYYFDFFQCQNCQQVYWEGSHFNRLTKFVDDNLNHNS